ncbi:MAG: hypothetical protein PHE81_02620 [Atribacterota bacterium]|jgi:hypothetical protein|nr:hypothetical protein [Atribacterota bacterium]MDD3030929.1 hypothetical protein [Atribacterota bacterium]MDD3640456.1 hypothetical protein [Atribacterota bacterium]MDD4288600.1 hypothetical protein [Atribacterota bacterium]MDD4764797.1 hypothetical protein [Atribacterota bacterium]
MEDISVSDFNNYSLSSHFASKLKEVEKSINALSDVLFSKIMLDKNKEIKEIHIITKDCCNPKKVSRDIESLLIAQHDIAVDYRKISIAQIKEENDYLKRLKFSDAKVSSNEGRFQVTVTLENQGKKFEGKIDCVNWSNNREFIIARATLDAITSFLNGKVFFQIDEIKQFKMHEKGIVLISVNLIDSQGKENLIGSALIKENINNAIVNAILKAVNRRISFK